LLSARKLFDQIGAGKRLAGVANAVKPYAVAFFAVGPAHRCSCAPMGYPVRRPGDRRDMLKDQKFAIDDIYVPVKRRLTLDPKKVEEIAQNMLEVGQLKPILLRPDGERFVLVEGLHRLEACKALGETKILGLLVQARRN
jgi:sulfiredoxin